jgi:hypothetical protein
MTRHCNTVSTAGYGVPTRPVPTRPVPTRRRRTLFRAPRSTLISTLAACVLAGFAAYAPGVALAGGPLLSGYGGPGAGAQAIIGATLLSGPGGSSGGGSSSDGPTGASSASGSSHATTPSPTVSAASGGGGSGKTAHTRSTVAGAKRAHGGLPAAGAASSGAYSNALQAKAYSTASAGAGAPWFSGGDLLALVLAAGALALTAVATVRLAGSQHD